MLNEKEILKKIGEMPEDEWMRIMKKSLDDSGIPYPDGVKKAVADLFSEKPIKRSKKDRTWKRCSKCPICGGEIEIYEYFQTTRIHKLTKAGKVTKKYEQTDNIPEEVWTAACTAGCGAHWDATECFIDGGYFYDSKYSK